MPMWFVPRFVTILPSAPFGMVCLFCGSLRHRARDPVNVAFSNLRSRLLVYSNRLRCLLRRFGGAPSIQRPPNVPSCQHHTPLYFHPICFSHLLSLLSTQTFFFLVFFAPPLRLPWKKNHQFPIMSSSEGSNGKQTFPNEQLTNVFSRIFFVCVL